MAKRLLSFCLCFTLLFSMLPFQAAAEETEVDSAIVDEWTKVSEKMANPGNQFSTDADINLDDYPTLANFGIMTADIRDHSYYEHEPNNYAYQADVIRNDYTVTGTLEYPDLDYFEFTLTKKSRVTIVAVAKRSTFAMGILDPRENVLAADTRGEYDDGYYTYVLDGTATAGTYYLTLLDNDSSYNYYSFYIAIGPTTLSKPSVTITNRASDGKPKLTWKAVSGATKYQIYRSTSQNGNYTLMKTVTGTTYTNTSAKAGKTYYYKVRAVSANGVKSAFSSIVKRMCDLGNPDVTIKLKNGDPRLSWEKIAGATKYQIYRATSKSGKYTLMKTVTGTAYTNTSAKAGKTYFYKVKAIHKNTNANSAFSAIKSIKAK